MTSVPSSAPFQLNSPSQGSNYFLHSVGDAVQVTLLLSDWKHFGLSERVSYHLDLIETLGSGLHEAEEDSSAKPFDSICGVAKLLECVPFTANKDMSKMQKKALRGRIRDFNLRADRARVSRSQPYHRPFQLPLRLSPATRVSFAYEMTRMVLVLDASPTLVSAFGVSDKDEHFCAMDRLPAMAKTFFQALAKPVTAPYMSEGAEWQPILAVTVLAVFPHGGKKAENNTSILVRDFRMQSQDDAELLADKIQDWVLTDVEDTIAKRLNSGGVGLVGYDSWAIPKYTSSLRDLLDAGDVALDFLPSKAKPCLVLATDCRSVVCDEILDLFAYEERMDVPIHILDLSSPSSHIPPKEPDKRQLQNFSLASDPGGPFAFPLHMQDDSEALFAISRATGGCFLDSELMALTSSTFAGQVPNSLPLALDQYLAFRRRAIRPNALQCYILFAWSPLTPSTIPSTVKALPQMSFHPAGKLVPPKYIRTRLGIPSTIRKIDSSEDIADSNDSITTFAVSNNHRTTELRRPPHRTTFSTYVVAPVRIKGLLLTRIKEGYRAKQYGTSTHDYDKVSIQLTLPIENETVLHYELQYKALDSQRPMVGVAHVKVELSGYNQTYVQNIKNEFLGYTAGRSMSSRLCKVLWWTRREDLLQSFLCPVQWGDKLSSAQSPFVRRLGSLSRLQMMRNYRIDRFDVVCTGRLPFAHDEDLPWSDFVNTDNGEQELFETLAAWATQTVEAKSKYVKCMPTNLPDYLTSYCVVEVIQSTLASRLFTISINNIGGAHIKDRLAVVSELKDALRDLRDVNILPKHMYESLVGVSNPYQDSSHLAWRSHFLANHYEHEEWTLVKDPELLDLLMRRRSEIGDFLLLHSTENYALFAKDIPVAKTASDTRATDVYLVEYQIHLQGDGKQPIINMHVEKEVGLFSTDADRGFRDHLTRAHRLFVRVKRRDQECSVALRSRTNLLSLFGDNEAKPSPEDLLLNVKRLLAYASHHSRRLRFFQSFQAANDELERLTVDLMLSGTLEKDIVKLDLNASVQVGDQEAGYWFFVRIDRHTLSFVHLPLREHTDEKEGEPYSYRELNFFTFGISDLYCVRDESITDDDESTIGHISEYMAVEGFVDVMEEAHKEGYAQAAYLALRSQDRDPQDIFATSDFDFVLASCDFMKVTEVFVSQDTLSSDGVADQSKLVKTIAGLFSVVPGRDSLMFYSSEDAGLEPLLYKGDMEIADFDDEDASFDDELSSDESEVMEDTNRTSASQSTRTLTPTASKAVPPVFVRFSLDGNDIEHSQLSSIEKGANLSVQMSIFKQPDESRQKYHTLPELHRSVAIEIEGALKSYMAEQTLERLRSVGRSIQEVDLVSVRKCLRKAREVLVSFFDVHLYVAKSDKMVPASEQSSNESEIESGFDLLLKELQNSPDYTLRPTSNDCFCVVEDGDDLEALSYWGFITVKQSLGLVTVEVYSPKGLKEASSILGSLQNFVARICRRTNQLLLLQRLHSTRNASTYLIKAGEDDTDPGPFPPGHFSCPIVFEESYELYHRCTASKVISSLISTSLHSFSVSNRQHAFVYKDEAMGIFYLSLEEVAAVDEGPEFVKLLVFGVQEPGPSVTVQLTRLLRKKILLLAVEVWSGILTKNPHFSWKQADLDFLRNFESLRAHAEDTTDQVTGEHDYWFQMPPSVYDPLIVMMYFRQNLCGSTFFHRLNESSTDSDDQQIEDSPSSFDNVENGADVSFDPLEFRFFYNNAPSPLDPSMQAVSTLTKTGQRYCQQAGSGIALIEMSIVKKGEYPPCTSTFTVGTPPGSSVSQPAELLGSVRAKQIPAPGEAQQNDEESSGPIYLVHLRITHTELNREAVKNSLLLTLDQVLAAWTIERQIQRSTTGLLSVRTEGDPECTAVSRGGSIGEQRWEVIDKLCPGLQTLMHLFSSSLRLPHPAVKSVEFNTIMKSSSVASFAASLLRDCIVSPLACGKDNRIMSLMNRTLVIRSSRGDRPQEATLASTTEGKGKGASFQFRGGDSPIDCPEYLCYFCWELYSAADEEVMKDRLPMTFPAVMVGDAISDRRASVFSQRLKELKDKLPSAFHRSFGFVLTVKRNRRSLTTYNWDPKLVKSVFARIRDLEASKVSDVGTNLRSNQRRCLGNLAPLVQRSRGANKQSTTVAKTADPPERVNLPATGIPSRDLEKSRVGPTRRIQRPTSIRRPKLVGKSVEGGAMQAMAASRAKARAQTKGPSRVSTVKTAPAAAKMPPGSPTKAQKAANDDEIEAIRFRQRYGQVMGSTWSSSFATTKASFELLQEYWFRSAQIPIRKPLREVVLYQTKPLWNDCVELSSWARLLSQDLPLDFANHMEGAMKSVGACKVLSTAMTNSGSEATKSVFFMTAVRRSSMNTFLVFRIQARKLLEKKRRHVIGCDVWMMKFLRPDQKKNTKKRRPTRSLEKRAAVMGTKIGIADQLVTQIEAQLFDFSAAIVEEAARGVGKTVLDDEYLLLTEHLIQRYSVDAQQEMPRLKYRAFDANIILKSYEDQYIDKFDAFSLFKHIFESDKDTCIKCGKDTILFRRSLKLYNTTTYCFLKRDRTDKTKMHLIYLCRTEGTNIDDHVFPEGSNVAATIFKMIVIEGARLALHLLRDSAIEMHRDSLWKFASLRNSNMQETDKLEELLSMLSAKSVLNENMKKLLDDPQLKIDPEDVFKKMSRDQSFSPCRRIRVHANGYHELVFNSRLDAFIMFKLSRGRIADILFMRRDEVAEGGAKAFVETFTNYLLFYLWKT